MSNAEDFVVIMRQMVKEEINKMDRVVPCSIVYYRVSTDTADIVLLSDNKTIVYGIHNFSKFKFNSGDVAYLYLIQNRLSDSFIIGKQGGYISSPPLLENLLENF